MKLNFMYGTAWKEDLTADCVYAALKSGYRAIDTANQRKHYNEPGVGEALLRAYKELDLRREDLFIQTKFTYSQGQDHRKPYNDNDEFSQQVRSSFESSLGHLHTDYLDSLILHGPFRSMGIAKEDKEVWQEMESLHVEGLVKYIGISNVSVSQLEELYDYAKVKPKFVQIRCFAENKWEKEHRKFCLENGIIFQGFSLLTANRQFIGGEYNEIAARNVPQLSFNEKYGEDEVMGKIISATNKSPAQIIFKFCQQIGILPITGTRTLEHMLLNLDINDFELSPTQVSQIENIAFRP